MINFEHYKDELMKLTKNKDLQCDECPAKKYCKSDRLHSCSDTIITWGFKEYVPPKPKTHTMQEIADFFGKSVATDGTGSIYIFSGSPIYQNNCWNGYLFASIPNELVSDSMSHDCTVAVEPAEAHE